MDLQHHTTRSLDTQIVHDALLTCAATPMGVEALTAMTPLADASAARALYQRIDEWMQLAEERRAPPLGGAIDIRGMVNGAKKGEVLDPPDLVAIGRTLEVFDRASSRLLDDDDVPCLAAIAANLSFDLALMDELSVSFEPDGRLSDRRYPELRELRERIHALHGNLRSTLEQMAKGQELSDDLQDTFWTVRNDRYVLPLKPHAKNRGVVHGTSGSGKTVYVEPHEILELNNRLRLAEGALQSAERRILIGLSRAVGADAPALMRSLDVVIELDQIGARANLAHKMDARTVHVHQEGTIALSNAKHPILVLRELDVVPHHLALSADRPALVLTGPNTGGKTVALKTLGLCAWMVRHGLALPVGEDSRFDWFTSIFADVGDAQTVEDDLSSFSAQLVAVRGMLERAGEHVLILLDELASGTDPQQGAALAISVLEALVGAGCRIVTTTHYPPLKGLAATDPRFRVAAMEVVGGKPTYRLIPDTTGESHALQTAERMGLPADVLKRARGLWAETDQGVSQTLEALELQRADLQAQNEALTDRLAEVRRAEAELQTRLEGVKKGRARLEEEAALAFRKRLDKAKKAVSAVVANLQAEPSQKRVRAAKATLAAFDDLAPKPERLAPVVEAAVPDTFQIGDRVRHPTLGVGVVQALGKTLRIQGRSVAFNAKPAELTRVADKGPAKTKPKKPKLPKPAATKRTVALADAMRTSLNTINVRGMRVDEAMDAMDTGIDKAITGQLDIVFVLHGHGTGALKTAIRQALRAHRSVATFIPANADQGGDAFTVVEVR